MLGSRTLLLRAIAAVIAAIMRSHYGRGPLESRAYAFEEIVVVVMRDTGYTPLERTLMDDGGGAERVVETRHDFQLVVADLYKQAIEELTGRDVVAFLSQAHIEPDITIEVFCLDGPPLRVDAQTQRSIEY